MKWSELPADKKKLYVFSISLSAVLLSMLFLPKGIILPISAVVLALFFAACLVLTKKRSMLSVNKGQVLLLVAVSGILYIAILYLLGISFGFWRSPVPITIKSFFVYVLPISVIVASFEFIRVALLSSEKKVGIALAYVAGVFSELLVNTGLSGVRSFNGFMNVVGMALLPALSANLVYNYLAARYGAYPSMSLRLALSLYSYLIPFVPKVPDAMHAFMNVILPILVYVFISLLFEKKKRYAREKKRGVLSYVLSAVFIITSFLFIMLISCRFRYGLLVIATESMTGEIDKGDAVVYEEYNGQIIKEGEIIVFESNDSRIVHRVVEIQRINGQNRYYTMGDANPGRDTGYRTDSDIVGVTQFKIKHVGHPTLWLRSIFR